MLAVKKPAALCFPAVHTQTPRHGSGTGAGLRSPSSASASMSSANASVASSEKISSCSTVYALSIGLTMS